MKIVIPLFFVFLVPWNVYSQLNNTMFEQLHPFTPADSNTFFLGVNALGFVKNNEYFNKIADGYTLFGYQINPFLSYHAGTNFIIDAGVYLQQDFGASGYRAIAPTFSLKYYRDDFSLIFGTLEGSIAHRLIAPLYDFENVLNRRLENGMQLKWNKKAIFLDAWVDWQNMIYKGDEEQEEIVGGLSLNYEIIGNNRFKWRLPVQVLLKHRGGQIDNNPAPLETFGNAAAGIELEFPVSTTGWIQSVRTDNYFVYSRNFSSSQSQALSEGNGWYFNFNVETKYNLEMMVSYWRGEDFVSIMGGQLYPSVSSTFKYPNVVEQTRELLIVRVMHNLKISDQLTFSTRFEPFFDLQNGNFEFSHGFYINYTPDFFLTRTRDSK